MRIQTKIGFADNNHRLGMGIYFLGLFNDLANITG